MQINEGYDRHAFFYKQRRNLIVVSLFVTFYEAASLEIERINILGNQTEIGRPEVISFALTLAFIYFVWRYYTACREVNGIQTFIWACREWAEQKCEVYTRKVHVDNDPRYKEARCMGARGPEVEFRLVPQRDGDQESRVRFRQRYWYYFGLAIAHVTLRTSNFSGYLLPYLFAAVAALEILGVGVVSLLV
ncbi:hypothetical protein KAJ83_10410 [Marivibrio halodurans]|uniref:SMODS and SLOG-associating 2TM effector domain-containing protein n=1 Tax=Marivibrio halodurans TaxID=2039722 RepID=A0A8J7RZG5_9PROT|nr:hypothetical protein [Marivibrio halodurans]MBP5857420.1 hypothetical protein [Marivibrio halodurans]